MGFTRHFTTDDEPEAYVAVRNDAKVIIDFCASLGINVQREDDNPSSPYLGDDYIAFNGVGDDGHETFVLFNGANSDNFCKTARKSYDAVVAAILRRVGHHYETADISDEGGNDEEFVSSIIEACFESS